MEPVAFGGRLTPGTYTFTISARATADGWVQDGGVTTAHAFATADLTLSPCFADLDGNAQSDVFDLLIYLDDWFAGDPTAERTRDDPAAIDVFDLLAYLDDWFVGC